MERFPEAEIERLKKGVPVQRLVEASGIELKKGGKMGWRSSTHGRFVLRLVRCQGECKRQPEGGFGQILRGAAAGALTGLAPGPESSLHCNDFRDYDPRVGRHVQSDPIGLAGGINTYGHVVTPLNNLWHCFGCGVGGGQIDWVMKRHRGPPCSASGAAAGTRVTTRRAAT
jgi:RHS repeat-associated protein